MERNIKSYNIDTKKMAEEFLSQGNFGRDIRRKSKKFSHGMPVTFQTELKVTQDDIVNNENDLDYLNSQLDQTKNSLTSGLRLQNLYREARHMGMSEEILTEMGKGTLTPAEAALSILGNKPNPGLKLGSSQRLISIALETMQNPVYLSGDEEDRKFMYDLIKSGSVSMREVINEGLRADRETINLIQYQLEWLKGLTGGTESGKKLSKKERRELLRQKINEQKQAKLVEIEQPQAEVTEDKEEDNHTEVQAMPNEESTLEIPEIFPLANWEVYWTSRMWSHDDKYLVHLPTSSEVELSDSLAKVGKGQISVKPTSITRALKYHLLDKTVVQRSLTARNRYCKPEIRDWIKVKRGDDRVLIYVPDPNQNRAVFFAAGRDVVYREI